MPRSIHRLLLMLAVIAMTNACGGNNSTPTAPTEPPLVTEVFSGAVNPNGAATHAFPTQRSGSVTATLTTVGPDNTIVLGFSMGTWNGVNCHVVLSNDSAVQGSVVIGNASSAGALCVRVYDVGNFTESISYEVQVVHP